MEDMQTVIILLSVIVGLLSFVILAMLVAMIALLVKLNRFAQRVDTVTANVARASEWLSPTKVFSEVKNLFRS